MNFVVLMTVYNRRETTLRCLERLFALRMPVDTAFTVFLVDDGSTDGTATAVAEHFPQVRIIQGDGNLYWNQGMRLAWRTAVEAGGFDGYLWLNDDVRLEEDALLRLWETFHEIRQRTESAPIIVGTCRDPQSGLPSYGGRGADGKIVFGSEEPVPCSWMNGNFVYVPDAVYVQIGMLSQRFHHGYGDYEYGHRARGKGVPMVCIPGYIGSCPGHGEGAWSDRNVSLRSRWRRFHSPSGLNPGDFFRYKRVTSGAFVALAYLVNAYRRMLFGVAK